MNLKNELQRLAKARQMSLKYRDDIALLQSMLEKSEPWIGIQDTLNAKKSIDNEISEIENSIRERVLELSKATNYEDRKPVPGTEVKKFTVVNITDETAAKKWASENAPSMLSLAKKFNGMVEALEVPFKEVVEEYRAQISSDLSAYLENENT